MATDQRELPIVSFIFLLIGAILFIVGVALPNWLEWSETDEHCGLWYSCADSCSGLLYDDFHVPEIAETEMPSAWIVTQGLSCTAIACAVVGCLAYIVWLTEVRNRNAGLTAVSFHFLTGVFGAAAVVVFGVYWDDFPNGFAFWLTVSGAALCLLVGLTVALIVICTCQGISRRRYVRRRRRVSRRVPSDTQPVLNTTNKLAAQVPMAVPIAYPQPLAIAYPQPAPTAIEPAEPQQVVINNTQSNPQDLQVTAVYNGPSGGFYEGTIVPDYGQHSATVYVDSTYSNHLYRF